MEFLQWVTTLPENVKPLAIEFPIGTYFHIKGETWHVMSYSKDDTLTLSTIDPFKGYGDAVLGRKLFCAAHLRGENVKVINPTDEIEDLN